MLRPTHKDKPKLFDVSTKFYHQKTKRKIFAKCTDSILDFTFLERLSRGMLLFPGDTLAIWLQKLLVRPNFYGPLPIRGGFFFENVGVKK